MAGKHKSKSSGGLGGDNDLRKMIESIAETVNALKKRFDRMDTRMDDIKDEIRDQMEKIMGSTEKMKSDLAKMEKRITDLEAMNHDMDQNARMKDVIISGLVIKPRSYARAVDQRRDVDEPNQGEDVAGTVKEQVVEFFRSKDINLNPDAVDACFVLPRRGSAARAATTVMLKFCNLDGKNNLLSQRKKLHGSSVFVNDNLTRKNAEIAWKARCLKKDGKIEGTWVRNCKVFIKTNGSPEESRVLSVKEEEELEQFY